MKRINSTNDANLRKASKVRGYILVRSRLPDSTTNRDGYQIRSGYNGDIVAGLYYELTAEDVREFLNNQF